MTAPTGARPRPGPLAPRPYKFPRFERIMLENGLELVVAPVEKLPIVTVLALIDGGAVSDSTGREGLAMLTARALIEGTQRSDGAALSERFELLGTSMEASADWEAAMAAMTVASERLPQALSIFAEVITTPAFSDREIERLKAERLADLLQLRAEPRGLADEMFARFVYASDSRYSRPDGGDAETVGALTRDDVVAFYQARYRPQGSTLIIVGDVTVERAAQLVRESLGSWRGAKAQVASTPDRAASDQRRVHLVTKDDAPQSELRIGHVGIPRTHPDYFQVVVMNMVLGGLFNSRINLNLREAHAYTYGAFSSFDWRRGSGPFEVSTAVKSDVTDAAAAEVLKEIDRVRAEEITVEELSLATSYLDGVFPIRYETTAAIANALATLVMFGLPEDYFDTYRDKIRAVTRADVLRVATAHLHPDRLQTVVVGDPAIVRSQLESLGSGPLTVYDAEGRQL
jgi:zinc protease